MTTSSTGEYLKRTLGVHGAADKRMQIIQIKIVVRDLVQ